MLLVRLTHQAAHVKHVMKMLNLIAWMLTIVVLSNAEVFTALVDLENVINTERNMLDAIKTYVKGEEEKLNIMKKIVEKVDSLNREAVDDPEHYLGHPVNGYLLVKRFLWEWTEIENMVRLDDLKSKYLVNITRYRDFMPDNNDLNGAATALLRLQETYKLDTSNIANGRIEGTRNTPQLTAHECFELGRVAHEASDHTYTIQWMREALDRMPTEVTTEVNATTILDYLAWAVYQNGNMEEALEYTHSLLELEPANARALHNKAFFDYHIKNTGRVRRSDASIEEDDEETARNKELKQKADEEKRAYEALCRGDKEAIKIPANNKLLRCRYQHYGQPQLFLAPAKEEVVFDRPLLIIFHDELTEFEINTVKELALPRLSRASIQTADGRLEAAKYRISKSAWLKSEDHPVIKSIRSRGTAYTRLNFDTAEEVQVVNYGIGGHYEPHFDFARKEEMGAFKSLGTGNRIATLLFYLSDVEAGGGTVFPKVGARVVPKKGSAVFWFNLHPSGEGNLETRHAGCPVLVGSKWVSNIWIHEHGQEFVYKCDLDKDKY